MELWPMVLPFKITACVMAALIACVTLAAPAAKWRRGRTLLVVSGAGLLMFIPSCVFIQSIVDSQRFGVFTCATFDEIDDERVERFLPPSATEITIDKTSRIFRARFRITQQQLDAFLEEKWAQAKRANIYYDSDGWYETDRERHDNDYGDLGWQYFDDASASGAPVTWLQGSGFWLTYSPSQGIAYQTATYWSR